MGRVMRDNREKSWEPSEERKEIQLQGSVGKKLQRLKWVRRSKLQGEHQTICGRLNILRKLVHARRGEEISIRDLKCLWMAVNV